MAYVVQKVVVVGRARHSLSPLVYAHRVFEPQSTSTRASQQLSHGSSPCHPLLSLRTSIACTGASIVSFGNETKDQHFLKRPLVFTHDVLSYSTGP